MCDDRTSYGDPWDQPISTLREDLERRLNAIEEALRNIKAVMTNVPTSRIE